MSFEFTPSDQPLADLRGIRLALESRKSLLFRTYDEPTRVLIEKEIVALRELVMSLAQGVWAEARQDAQPGPG